MALTLNEKVKIEGYAVVKNLLAEEHLAEVSTVTERLIRQWQSGQIESEDFRTYDYSRAPGPILYRIHNLEKKHSCIEQLVDLEPFRNTVRSVMGADVVPTAFALIIKMPFFGGKVPYHRDPIDALPGTVYNFSVFLDEATPDNGCFEAVPRSHLFPGSAEMSYERPEGSIFIGAQRGDVLIHDVRIIHGSALSYSEKMRRSVCIEFQPIRILESLAK